MRNLTQTSAAENATSVWTSMKMPMTMDVQRIDADGNAEISYHIGRLEMDTETGGQQQYIVMDPQEKTMTVNGQPVPLPEPVASMFSQPMSVTMSPRGGVMGLSGFFGLNTLFGGGASGNPSAASMEVLRKWQMAFPVDPIGVGYSWGSSGSLPTGEGSAEGPAPMSATMVYTLSGFEDVAGAQCAKIDMVGAIDINELPQAMMDAASAAAGAAGANMSTRVGPGHMSLQGSMLFDVAGGRIVRTDATVYMDMMQRITGSVTANGETQQIDTMMDMRNFRIDTTATTQ